MIIHAAATTHFFFIARRTIFLRIDLNILSAKYKSGKSIFFVKRDILSLDSRHIIPFFLVKRWHFSHIYVLLYFMIGDILLPSFRWWYCIVVSLRYRWRWRWINLYFWSNKQERWPMVQSCRSDSKSFY